MLLKLLHRVVDKAGLVANILHKQPKASTRVCRKKTIYYVIIRVQDVRESYWEFDGLLRITEQTEWFDKAARKSV